MKRISVLCLLFIAFPAHAEVKIKVKDRIENRPPGYCGVCCLETIGRHYGLKEYNGLTDWYQEQTTAAYDSDQMLAQVKSFKTKHHYFDGENTPEAKAVNLVKFCRKHTDATCPVIVFIWKPGWVWSHAVVLLDITDEWVRFYDPNDPKRDYSYETATFLEMWGGKGFVLFK